MLHCPFFVTYPRELFREAQQVAYVQQSGRANFPAATCGCQASIFLTLHEREKNSCDNGVTRYKKLFPAVKSVEMS